MVIAINKSVKIYQRLDALSKERNKFEFCSEAQPSSTKLLHDYSLII